RDMDTLLPWARHAGEDDGDHRLLATVPAPVEMSDRCVAALAEPESRAADAALAEGLERAADVCGTLVRRLLALARLAREHFEAMKFGFLLDPTRDLLTIGYRVLEGDPDPNCYDLLASEARLASFIAIAKGDVPASHWFQLGRAMTPVDRGSALVSWSGSMFEYLMPALVMRSPPGSLLEQTYRFVVRRHVRYGATRGVPWGVSESAFNARDLELTYQYSNFGVPGLGLKRGAMRARFHAEPIVKAADLLLQERAPRDVAVARPRAEEVKTAAHVRDLVGPVVRRFTSPNDPVPRTHLLSNGHYAVMITAAGSGYSRWRDLAITRWREDVTRDAYGQYLFLRDENSGDVWSA